MLKRWKTIFCSLWVFLISIPCFGQLSQICGKIINAGTAQPLRGAIANVQNSEFVSTTNQSGRYCLNYAPGKFTVSFRKVGYFPQGAKLNLTQKAPYGMEPVKLHPAPRLIDMYGRAVSGASIVVKPLFGNRFGSEEMTDSQGQYTFQFVPGECQVFFQKPGYRTDGFVCNLSKRQYPQEKIFILPPKKFGVYVEQVFIPSVEVRQEKAPPEPYRGGLNIPRLRGHWEGDYYLVRPPNPVRLTESPTTFYFYPAISGRLGPGDDPLKAGLSVLLLRVEANGRFASFGPDGGDFRKVEAVFEPVVQRVSKYQGGLVSQSVAIYKIKVNLPPGRYSFCQFEKPSLHGFPIPGKEAYYFEVVK